MTIEADSKESKAGKVFGASRKPEEGNFEVSGASSFRRVKPPKQRIVLKPNLITADPPPTTTPTKLLKL